MGFRYVKDYNGVHTELEILKAQDAVKEGDALKLGTNKNEVTPVTAGADLVIGVASHDADAGEEVAVYPAGPQSIFEVPTVTTGYVEATYKYQKCDITDFTSGAMKIDPATTTSGQVKMVELQDGETSGSIGNKVLVAFTLRAGV